MNLNNKEARVLNNCIVSLIEIRIGRKKNTRTNNNDLRAEKNFYCTSLLLIGRYN